MDLKILREFMYLSKDLNFTKTAKRCYISQPVLSRHMQALEQELGCELFIRGQGGLRLTPYGEAFAVSCKKIDNEWIEAVSQLDNMRTGFLETLRVVYVSPLATGFLDKVYAIQLERYPQVKLELMATWEDRAIVMLNQGKADISIVITFPSLDTDVYDTLPLFKDRYIVLVPDDNPLANHDSLKLQDLSGQTVLIPSGRDFSSQYMHLSEELSHYPDIEVRASLNNKHDCIALANAGRGIPLVRSNVISDSCLDGLKVIPVDEDILEFDIRAVWKKDNTNPTMPGFVEILAEVCKSKAFPTCYHD